MGDRLKRWRSALGLTQGQFASLIGMHVGMVRKYEGEVQAPGASALQAIASTGVNVHWLLTGDGEMRAGAAGEGADDGEQERELAREEPAAAAQPQAAARWEKLIEMVEGIEDEDRRAAAMQDLFARAQELAELDALRQAVAKLQDQAG
ncbi:hypothetical protein CKO33_02325 [Ectothiorhodospira mobilis]|nr:hypothetical protein [Ectothiorhodospira mobilis]